MAGKTIAVLMPGDMGHGVGAALKAHGCRVVTCLAGRSERTRSLAEKAGVEDLGNLEAVVRDASLVLSILPPTNAVAQAGREGRIFLTRDTRPASPLASIHHHNSPLTPLQRGYLSIMEEGIVALWRVQSQQSGG